MEEKGVTEKEGLAHQEQGPWGPLCRGQPWGGEGGGRHLLSQHHGKVALRAGRVVLSRFEKEEPVLWLFSEGGGGVLRRRAHRRLVLQ